MITLFHDARLVAPMDDARTQIPGGWVAVEDDRVLAVGPPPVPERIAAVRRIDARGKVILPGLVNTHHHLPQVLTRNVPRVQEAPLFHWLVELYEVWRHLDAAAVTAAARVGLGELLLTGCTTGTDHLYLFPESRTRFIDAEIQAARELGIRFHPTRGSMSLSEKDGGLPPDDVVGDDDEILAASEAAVAAHHDREHGAMVRIAIAPCSPFTVTERLMVRAAELAERLDVRLHTHFAENAEDDEFFAVVIDHFGRTLEGFEQVALRLIVHLIAVYAFGHTLAHAAVDVAERRHRLHVFRVDFEGAHEVGFRVVKLVAVNVDVAEPVLNEGVGFIEREGALVGFRRALKILRPVLSLT